MFFEKIRSFFSSRTIAFSALIFWMAVIFSFSMLPGEMTSSPPSLWYFVERKGAHVVEYALLMFLSFNYFRITFWRESSFRLALLAAVFALAYAVTDELHQFFVPLRGARMSDVLIDAGGILIAGLTLFFFEKMKNHPR